MFMQDGMYAGYIDKFFASQGFPGISWIQDVDQKRYGDASKSLLTESKVAADLETKHVSTPFYYFRTTLTSYS